MKKWFVCILLVGVAFRVPAQSYEIQQLLLDIEKLAQFKQILSDLKKGYEILNNGYGAIKNISQGNFNLHQNFLDALLQVSPTVQKYKRIADIISYQQRIVKSYTAAFDQFRRQGNFSPDEIEYIGKVYSNLFNESMKNLDELLLIITAGKLRMNDDERLRAIDRIFIRIQDQYAFVKDFNGSAAMLSLQRSGEQQDIDVSRKLYDLR